ncbi:MAG: SRPBCC family protein [Anaerolineaceae bacterium]|nr:SRPBCC family protein [Anaerolineaceae bacterium]
MKFKESIFINRSVEEVFTRATDYDTHPKWADTVRVDILTNTPFGVGTRMNYVSKFLGREMGMESEITIYEPPHRLGYKIISGMAVEALQSFTEENNGTRATWEYWGDITGVLSMFKLAEPLLARQAHKTMQTSLKKLKSLLETEEPVKLSTT